MKTTLCLIVFVLLPVAKLRPTVVGSTFSIWGLCSPQLRAGQPSAGKQGFAYSIMTLTLRL
ncbi:hypothetical protein F2Y81_10130 [Bacteroides cellulosilyticus]|uniref:Uncharacterized protein n=1 Tax=Bacteroides cellulosilyticus TaxID=246787 RepID=A0A3D6AZV4_9BACE|nr:hypothetical protein F2Y81_10130 [Bacteroides cellulosilyticus]HCY72302.1 hypothetical protein [Bacteroides cellulosilyticus]